MDEKPPGHLPGAVSPPNEPLPYPGPPEYVQHGYPVQPPYPLAVQQYGHQPYGMPPPQQPYGIPPGQQPYDMPPPPQPYGMPPVQQPYGIPPQHQRYPPPPPVIRQPHPFNLTEGFYAENPPTPPPGDGDPKLALEYLKTVTFLQVRQKIEMLEILTGFETENRYGIYNEAGQLVFNALEDSECCARHCCGPKRPLDIRIVDLQNTEVIHLNRPLNCQSCLYPCCLQVMEVTAPPGTLVTTINQCWSLWPKFNVNDGLGNTILHVEGPFFTCSCCRDVNFNILSANDGTEIGQISKKWSGFANEYFTDADNFKVSFPQDLDVTLKVGLLGAIFLIDMMYYEQPQNKNH